MHNPVSDLLIRPAEPADASLISDLIHELAAFEKQPADCHATPDGVRTTLLEPGAESPPARVLLAEVDGIPAGFALYFFTYSTWECAPGLYLEDIYVRPVHRRRGVGRALLQRLTDTAVQRGCRRLELSVLDWNDEAIEFYEAHGARPNAGWTVYRMEAEDLKRMTKVDRQG
jgi:GNAT superfamily N-acetyltransferase